MNKKNAGNGSQAVSEVASRGLMAENEKDFSTVSVVRGEGDDVEAHHEGRQMLRINHGSVHHDAGHTPASVHMDEADSYYDAEGQHASKVEPRPMVRGMATRRTHSQPPVSQ